MASLLKMDSSKVGQVHFEQRQTINQHSFPLALNSICITGSTGKLGRNIDKVPFIDNKKKVVNTETLIKRNQFSLC